MPRPIIWAPAIIATVAMTACSSKPSDAKSSTSTSDINAGPTISPDDNAPLYPDWAKAVLPAYPHTSLGILVSTAQYQFQSADDLETVASWYKARVTGSWEQDATDGAWSVQRGGLRIAISRIDNARNAITTGDSAERAKTIISLSHL